MKVTEEMKSLVAAIREMRGRRDALSAEIRGRMLTLNKLRGASEDWAWCTYCGKRHRPYSNAAYKHRKYLKSITNICLFEADHCWKWDGKFTPGPRDEIGIPQVTEDTCIICGRKRKSVTIWK